MVWSSSDEVEEANHCPFCDHVMVQVDEDVVCPLCNIGTRGFAYLSMAIHMWNIHTKNLKDGNTPYKRVVHKHV
jgi:hypothetical protein